ncbi:MAG: hypothetical protein LM564_05675 [Desulfurococcaceae archaeon]|nr:hypothetical protein [Desulfurococcaceae archaeon]
MSQRWATRGALGHVEVAGRFLAEGRELIDKDPVEYLGKPYGAAEGGLGGLPNPVADGRSSSRRPPGRGLSAVSHRRMGSSMPRPSTTQRSVGGLRGHLGLNGGGGRSVLPVNRVAAE